MIDLVGNNFDPLPEYRRPGLTEMQKIRNISLDYIARLVHTAVKQKGGKVIVADGAYQSLQEAVDSAGGIGNIRCVFGSSMSATFPELLRVFYLFAVQGVPCVGGGIHLTARPDDLERFLRPYLPANAAQVSAVCGSADCLVIDTILDEARAGTLKKKYRGGIQMEQLYWQRFPWSSHGDHHMRCLEVSRGCPYSCPFCSISVVPREQRRLEVRDMDDVLHEIGDTWSMDKPIQRRLRFLVAENIYVQKKLFSELLERIIHSGIKLNFVAQADALIALDNKFLTLLQKAGCINLLVGFESLNGDNLRVIQKRSAFSLIKKLRCASVQEAYSSVVKRIQDHGITVVGAFILGLPYDRLGAGKQLGAFMARHNVLPHPTALTALPGAQFFEKTYRDRLIYGYPDEWPKDTGPYPAAFSGMDLTETNIRFEQGLQPREVQEEIRNVVESLRSRTVPGIVKSMQKSFSARGLGSVTTSLLSGVFTYNFYSGIAHLERRLHTGSSERRGALQRRHTLHCREKSNTALKEAFPTSLRDGTFA
jgi:hypothetical protein